MTVKKKLSGRKALVTGGSRGIGAAIALKFASEGCDVTICHLGDDENATKTCERIQDFDQKALTFECNVADEHAVEKMVTTVVKQLGQVDILVNCAGIEGVAAFENLSVAAWDHVINVNLRGTFLVTRACYPGMVARRWGRIINIASQFAYKGAPELVHYCASKAGVVGFTRALAYEGAPQGVLVNAIAPGPIETDMLRSHTDEWLEMKRMQLPLGRFGKPEEVAATAVLLASEDGSFYVGQTLSPNGGDIML